MIWAQELVEKEVHTGGEKNGNENDPNDDKSEDGIPSLKCEFQNLPPKADHHNGPHN
jgi:hypothetical protein